jgi:ketosteroid isomerase-like protein
MSAIDTVRAFNRHVDQRDVEGAVALLAENVEAVTPRGREYGPDSLRAYMARQAHGVAPVVQSRRYFSRGDAVVVGARFRYVFVESGEPAGPYEDRAELFHVREGRIRRFEPFGDLASALDAAGLTAADQAVE